MNDPRFPRIAQYVDITENNNSTKIEFNNVKLMEITSHERISAREILQLQMDKDLFQDEMYKHTSFGKVCDMDLSYDCLTYFIKCYISKHPNKKILLSSMSNLYVVAANTYKSHMWKQILKPHDYSQLIKNGQFILGYALIEQSYSNKHIYFIELIDTLVSGQNLAAYMMDSFIQRESYAILIPRTIIYTSAGYWDNYFEKMYHIDNKKDIEMFVNEHNINKKELNWELLFSSYRVF